MNNINNINTIQTVFERNQVNLIKAYKAQNYGNHEEAILLLEESKNNFLLLGNILDKTNQGQLIYRENREILSSQDIKTYTKEYPNLQLVSKDSIIINDKLKIIRPKQLKTKWSEIEEKLFREGIELYGKRSK
jgi:hypothetical protein